MSTKLAAPLEAAGSFNIANWEQIGAVLNGNAATLKALIESVISDIAGKYSLPEGGIGLEDLAQDVISAIEAGGNGDVDLSEYLKSSEANSTYVAKVSGKGLSTNDFNNTYKSAIDNLSTTISNAIVSALIGYATTSSVSSSIDTKLADYTPTSTLGSTYATKTELSSKYTKPSGGIGTSDLSDAVNASLTKANNAVQSNALTSYSTTSQMNNAIANAVADAENPIEFKGSVAATSNLPTASSSNKNHEYFVTADSHYYRSNGTSWVDVGTQSAANEVTQARADEYGYSYPQLKNYLAVKNAEKEHVAEYASNDRFVGLWEQGVYYNTSVGLDFALFDDAQYLSTRKRLHAPVRTLAKLYIEPKSGYGVSVYTITDNNKIKTYTANQTHYEVEAGERFAAFVYADNKTDDISDVPIDDIVTIEYENAINALSQRRKDDIEDLKEYLYTGGIPNIWEGGTYMYGSGEPFRVNPATNNARKRLKRPFKAIAAMKVQAKSGYGATVYYINESTYRVTSYQMTSGTNPLTIAQGSYIAMTLWKTGDAAINNVSVDDIIEITYTDGIYKAANSTHSDSGSIAADVIHMSEEPTWTTTSSINAGTVSVNDSLGMVWGSSAGSTSALASSNAINCSGYKKLEITMINSSETTPPMYGLVFYDSDGNAIAGKTGCAHYGRKTGDDYYKIDTFFIPDNAATFKTTYWSAAYISTNCPDALFDYTLYKYDNHRHITNEIPSTLQMENCIRRCRQLTDIKFRPLAKIPRYMLMDGDYSGDADDAMHFLDFYKQDDTEYTGIPYSGSGQGYDWTYGSIDTDSEAGKWGYYMLTVGSAIPLEAFVTAARYPNSILGSKATQQSPDYDSSPYGAFCSSLVSYAFGLEPPIWPITSFPTGSGKGANYFYKVETNITDMNAENIKLCDILWNTTHVALITDIIRDSNGAITDIEVSEATTVGCSNNTIQGGQFGGRCRRKMWTVSEFFNWFKLYGLYRFRNFANITYERSMFVDTGNEGIPNGVVDLPLIPYLGNGAIYKVGSIKNTKILIGATGFTSVTIKRDGVLFNQIAIPNGQDYVEGEFNSAGNYEAYLTDANGHKSRSCKWTVVA